MQVRFLIAIMSVLSMLATGCYGDSRMGAGSRYDALVGEGEADSVEITQNDVTFSRAWLEGDMGDVDGFVGTAYQIERSGNNITIHTGDRGGAEYGWVMVRLQIRGLNNMTDERLAPGTMHTINGGSPEGDIRDVVGCSGPRHGNFTFDQHPPDVEVVVTEGPNDESREVEFVLEFANGEITHGGFTITPNNEPTDAPY